MLSCPVLSCLLAGCLYPPPSFLSLSRLTFFLLFFFHMIWIRYATFCALAGVDPTNDVYFPLKNGTQVLRSIDSVNVWPLLTGANLTQPRAITPITEASIIHVVRSPVSGVVHFYKLITKAGNSVYYDAATSAQIAANDTCLAKSQGDPAEPGRTDPILNCIKGPCCAVCNATMPCVYDLLADPREASNVAVAHPEVIALLAPILAASNDHYVSGHLDPSLLARDYVAVNTSTEWGSFVGPCYRRK